MDLLDEEEGGGVTVTFPDIPEALTCGSDREEALAHANDALESALDFYFDDGRPVPTPSVPNEGQATVELSSSVATRVQLHNERLAAEADRVELPGAHRES